MNWIDVILILVIGLSVYGGFKRGFIIGALELASWIAGILFALWSYQYVSNWLEKFFPNLGIWTMPLAFILALIFARIILSLMVNKILQTTPPAAHTNVVNRALGVVPGFVNGVIFAAIIATLLLVFPFGDGLSTKMRESTVANQLTDKVEKVEAVFAPVFDEAIKRSMTKITVDPKSEKSIKLPFEVERPKVREDLEAEMLVLINEERQKEGLNLLKADPEIRVPARAHSVDMFERSYFSHVNPDGKDPFDRIRAARVRFIAAGENLALAQTLKIAHTGLMNSPGHRANILQKSFGRVGIGILDGGRYGLMITQNFRN